MCAMLASDVPLGGVKLVALKKALLEEYGSFSDKRIKNVEKGKTFIVDDRHPSDQNSSGEFNMAFCFIFATVLPGEKIELMLHRNVPLSADVRRLIAAKSGEVTDGITATIKVEFSATDTKFLRDLAASIKAITAPGCPRYHVSSWKYTVPRVVGALLRLAGTLDAYAAKGETL